MHIRAVKEAVTPYASTVGQQKKATWQWDGSVFRYFDANGVQETIAQLEKKSEGSRNIHWLL